jgi:hypothetical protein
MKTNLLALPGDCPICKSSPDVEVYRANDDGTVGIACPRCGRAYVTFRVFEKLSDLPLGHVLLHRLAAHIRKENLSSRYPHVDAQEWPRLLNKLGVQEPLDPVHGPRPRGDVSAPTEGRANQDPVGDSEIRSDQRVGSSWWHLYSKPLGLTLLGYVALLLVLFGTGQLKETWSNLTTAYFLIANLIVLWWYAHQTRLQAEAAGAQVTVGLQQYELALRQRQESNKPFVVLERMTDPDRQGFVHYLIRNVGPGVAVNVFHVSAVPETATKEKRAGQARFESLGALAPGASRVLPEPLEAPLRDARGQSLGLALVAEGIAARTARWGLHA